MSKVISTPKKPSPYLLIQEFLRDDPWKLLVACIMLNQTSARQVHGIINEFFDRYPDAGSLIRAPEDEVKRLIKPLGFQNIRYERLLGMSMDWYEGLRPPEKLHGVGKYASDSYQIFIGGYLISSVRDKELSNYVRWAKEEGKAAAGVDGAHP